MKQKTFTLLIFLISSLNGCAIEPIEEEQSFYTTPSAVNEIPKPDEHQAEEEVNPNASRLWFHVRNEQQLQLIEAMGDKLKLDNNLIIEPVQSVETGPRKTQLRFFTLQDKQRAKELLKKFNKFFPKLQLLDLSFEYGATIEPGHFELWLSPDVKKITSVQPLVPLISPSNPVSDVTKP